MYALLAEVAFDGPTVLFMCIVLCVTGFVLVMAFAACVPAMH